MQDTLKLLPRFVADPSQPQTRLFELKECLADSNLPILVDDWARIPESFRKGIERGGTVQVQSGKPL